MAHFNRRPGSKPKYRPSKARKNLKIARVVPSHGAWRVEFEDDFSIQVHSGSGRGDLLYAMKPTDMSYEKRSPGPETRRDYQYLALKAVLGDRPADFVIDHDGDVMAYFKDAGAVAEATQHSTSFERGFAKAVQLWNDGSTIATITNRNDYDASEYGRGMYAAVEALSGFYDSAAREAYAHGFSREEADRLARSVDTGPHKAREPHVGTDERRRKKTRLAVAGRRAAEVHVDRRRGYHGSRRASPTFPPGTSVQVAFGDSMYRGESGRVVRPDANRTIHLDNYNKSLLKDGAVLVERHDGSLFVVFPDVLERMFVTDEQLASETRSVQDYIAVDNRGRTIGGPFKSFSDAKDAAGGGGAVKFVPSSREAGEARRPPVDDPFYIVQGMYSNGVLSDQFGFDEEAVAVAEAKELARSNTFEGDSVRVITRDGELVWDSSAGATEARRHQQDENAYGLTFEQWLRAAGLYDAFRQGRLNVDVSMLQSAWRAGEDPSEYRADASNATEARPRPKAKRSARRRRR